MSVARSMSVLMLLCSLLCLVGGCQSDRSIRGGADDSLRTSDGLYKV